MAVHLGHVCATGLALRRHHDGELPKIFAENPRIGLSHADYLAAQVASGAIPASQTAATSRLIFNDRLDAAVTGIFAGPRRRDSGGVRAPVVDSFSVFQCLVARSFRRNSIGHPVRTPEQPSKWMRRTIHITGKIEPFFGTLDENIRSLEDALHVRTHLHDTRLTVEGEQDGVDQAVRIVEEYNHLTRHGRVLASAEVKSLMRVATDEPHESPRGMFEHGKTRSFGKKPVTPKNASQKRYMDEIEAHDMTFGIGPGGTGKTYLAVAMAVSALLTKQMNRIILARPAVEAGERLGFFPGTLQQKIDPYMRPLYDALYDMLDADKLERFLEKGIIEVAPLAFMRGPNVE